MEIRGIRRECLDTLRAVGKSQHPREFVAVLRETDGIIEEFDLAPGTVVTEQSAGFSFEMMPLDVHTAGSAHSHPSGPLRPSDADLRFFGRMGKYHLIFGPPYGEGDWRVFRRDGTPAELGVIE
ncbi:Mov34/MPN/PAD-1 family protein [Methanogenium sp. S4BF]|uniref:Mov34/MPN/PAD-1 family protein n=1 Tax=Methanogenium sp. S4BF TaxID=1789226 RepID=UPI0024173D3C|nr:Mov34/MPN/PAD-1 family protein [Methanogenium sp. S4BF]WFN34431.1 Mov34/MPN/PAD-1 family protein [Methanogenium sp. S4BF]